MRRALALRASAVALALGTAAAGCGDDLPSACTVPDGEAPDWIATLRCPHDYELLWDEEEDAIFAHTRSVNWLIDREDVRDGEPTIYFINTRAYLLHYVFARAYLDYGPPFTPVGTHAEWNLLNYRRDDRRFAMGKLVHYLDQGVVTIELAAGDSAGADLIATAFARVAGRVYDGDRLRYRPLSATQEALLPALEAAGVPTIRTDEVFSGQRYQPLARGVGFGTLRFRRLAELAARPVGPTDVVVLDRVPNDLAMVSGLITEEFQTPLAHVNVLSKNRGTPNMGLAGAFDDPTLRGLEGRLVRLEVGPQDFAIEPAEPAAAQAYWDALRPAEPLVPAVDPAADDERAVVVVTGADGGPGEVGIGDGDRVGVKAANLGELGVVEVGAARAPLPLPSGAIALPFGFYRRHVAASGAAPMIERLLAEADALAPEVLADRLFAIRWTIFRAPLDPDDAARLHAALAARYPAATRLRFRSSTNVEDLAEFSGAGLYTSAGAAPADGAAAIEGAVKTVWASAWNPQAFVERAFYRVDHARVRMGVLIHPGYPDEVANGVALTINEFASNRPAYYLNSQVGEVSVTNPTGRAVPEQLLYYTWYEEPEVEVITRSSLVADEPDWPGGVSVMTDAELAELAADLEAIHRHFRARLGGGSEFAMDVEYKLGPGRRLAIKQARPLGR